MAPPPVPAPSGDTGRGAGRAAHGRRLGPVLQALGDWGAAAG
ncbi:hypothetical protein [Streptomyces sp. NPDC085529]